MPRRARVIVPGLPHHIVQRGHNRQAVFVEEADYLYYLNNLAEWKAALGLQVFSYCLMTNHVHLIVGANERVDSIGMLMKRLAGRQTRWVNKQEGRTGSLWESRYKVSPVDTDAYLLQCCRYVELNPVKARMVRRADDYRWSSYRARIGAISCGWLDEPPSFRALGKSERERVQRYRAYLGMVEDGKEEAAFIGAAVERNQLTGDRRLIDEVEKRTGLRIEFRGRGRPVAER